MLLAAMELRPLRAVSLIATGLPFIIAHPVALPLAISKPRIDDDYEYFSQTLLRRTPAREMTAAIVGTTVAVGVFILFLLFIAVFLWRRRILHDGGRHASVISPREHLYRKQRRNQTPRSRTSRPREGRRTSRSSREKRRTRTHTPKQPSSTAASVASSFSPVYTSPPEEPEMAQLPAMHSEPSRFRPPVSLPPLITQPQHLQSLDETVSRFFDPRRSHQVSRWSMSTLGQSLLRDTMQAPDPDRYTESSPSSRYPGTTPSAYGPTSACGISPDRYEPSPARRVQFAPVELPGCDGPSTSPWRFDPSPETPEGWSRGASEDDLVSPVLPRQLTAVEMNGRQATSSLNTIYEERESTRQSGS